MKKVLSVALCLMLLLGTVAVGGEGFAELIGAVSLKAGAETSGPLTYEISDGKVTITDCSELAAGALEIPSEIDGYPVTSIGDWAFFYCTGLTSITIPDSVTSIGDLAFHYCAGLTSVTIPDSVTSIGNQAFYGCAGLTSITIPDSVTSIGNFAFGDCTGLKSVTIPDSVTSIGWEAFYGCAGLTSITIPGSVTIIGSQAFTRCTGLTGINVDADNSNYSSENGVLFNKNKTFLVQYPAGKTDESYTVPDGVINIDNDAFSYCDSLINITVPDSVTNVNESFAGSTSLTDINVDENNEYLLSENGVLFNKDKTILFCYPAGKQETSYVIPDSVTSLYLSAFSDCTGLTSVTIGNSVTSIGRGAFRRCTGLTSVTIPDSVTSIGHWAFGDCTGLTSITIPDSVTSIDYNTFYGCTGLTSVIIGNSVTSIGNRAFGDCTGLTSVTIPDSVISIDEGAFEDCTGLTSVNIGNSVTSIGRLNFRGCTGLTSVTIPDSVTGIEELAFYGCTGLTSVTVGSRVETIGGSAFWSCTSLTDVYYHSTEEDWKAIAIDVGNDDLLNATMHFNSDPSGHVHTWDEGLTTKPATIFAEGEIKYTCTECGQTMTLKIPVIPATPTEKAEEIEKKNVLKDEGDDSAVYFDEDAGLPENTEFSVNIIETTDCYQSFTLDLISDGKNVEPAAPVWVKMPIPANWTPSNPPEWAQDEITVWHGNEKLTSFIDGNYIWFFTSHFSEFEVKFAENDEQDELGKAKEAAKAEIDKAVPADASDAVKAIANAAKQAIDNAADTAAVEAARNKGINDIKAQLDKEAGQKEEAKKTEIAIRGWQNVLKVDYRSKVTFNADVTNSAGKEIIWCDKDGKKLGTGTSYTTEVKKDMTVMCKTTDADGNEVTSQVEEIKLNSSSFITKIIAFFKSLFGSLPEYVDNQKVKK